MSVVDKNSTLIEREAVSELECSDFTAAISQSDIQKAKYGATEAEWLHFNKVLDLGTDLLPCVANPDAEIAENSKLKQLGKTPSVYNRDGFVIGMKDWTSHYASDHDIRRWAKQPDYGMLVICRRVKALDLDISDKALVEQVMDAISLELGVKLPIRRRANSSKCLLVFRLEDEMPKRVLKVEHGMIELLANGQQFVACGTHPSGVLYEWVGGLPTEIPEISREQLDNLMISLDVQFGTEPMREISSGTRSKGKYLDIEDPVADFLENKGLVLGEESDGSLLIACPWNDEHTGGKAGDTSTVWFRAGTRGHSKGHFKCLHAHCAHRKDGDFFSAVGYEVDYLKDFENLDLDSANGDFAHSASVAPSQINRFLFENAGVFSDRPSPGWIIKGVIPRAGLGMVYGASGSGKSFFVFDMIAAVVRGVEWRGHRVMKGRCAYIAAEGAGGFRSRIKAYQQYHKIDFRNFELMMLAAAPNFLLRNDVDDLVNAIRKINGADIIVVDTYAQVTPGANENTSEDMGKALRSCAMIHEATGALVILVHHAGKDASRGARGWSGNRAAADFEIEVSSNEDGRFARISKMKDGRDNEVWGFNLQHVNIGIDDEGDVISSCVVVEAPIPNSGSRVGNRNAEGRNRSKRKMGKWEKVILETFSELSLGGDVKADELLERAFAKKAADGKPRPIRYQIKRAFENLMQKAQDGLTEVDGFVREL